MSRRLNIAALLILAAFSESLAQQTQTFVLGRGGRAWQGGGDGIDPTILYRQLGRTLEDTTNTPGGTIDFDHRPGWIGPLFFEPEDNIAARVLETGGKITARNAFLNQRVFDQLAGTVNGDHRVAFELKPTLTVPEVRTHNVWVLLDFGTPVGVHRIRFYPRDTVVATPTTPFGGDFMRAYEVWINPELDAPDAPDILVGRNTANEVAVVDLEVPPQYVRQVKVRSLSTVPFEIDEIEVYGTGYMAGARYLSDIIDLGAPATIGPLRWRQQTQGNALFSELQVRVRTGLDETPILYRKKVRDLDGVYIDDEEVEPWRYYQLDARERVRLAEDAVNWSPWQTAENGALISAPNPRRFVQFDLRFAGDLAATHQVEQLRFDYLVPPLADALRAEIFPRLAQAEQPASFRYAVRLEAAGAARGFDRLEVDTNIEVEAVRQLTIDGQPVDFAVDFIRPEGFGLSFPPVTQDGSVLEFTFDLPIFRFGTTFSGRAFHSGASPVPQRLIPGNAQDFGPADFDELSTLFVAIPQAQIGKLVGQILWNSRYLTPNGDGVNDRIEILFNLLQLVKPAPVRLDIYDLAGRHLHTVFDAEHGIGEVQYVWDGRLADGRLLTPGLYIWTLIVDADAFEERHQGTLAVAY